jgi:hypothetical protein
MAQTGKRLSRPLYEGLPWIYVVGGAIALVGSYFCPNKTLGHLIGIVGLLGLVAGIVVLLRRRDFRAMQSEYGRADSTLSDLERDE